MKRTVRQRVTLASALSFMVSLSGCTALTPTACTAIGAESGITIALAGHKWAGSLTFEVCVGDLCSSSLPEESPIAELFVQNAGLISSQPTGVVVTVRDSGSAPVEPAQRTTVIPKKSQPNGPDCEPTVWQAAVAFTPGGFRLG